MGLVNLRARTYNPRLGAFTSVDPVLGVGGSTGWNGYVYANDNPANLVDPAGTCVDPLSFLVCAAAIVVGGLYINEWRGNTYANQMQGMSFWEAVSYDHNRPCPTCEVVLSFLVPPLGKAFAARDFAYTVATGTPAGKLEAIQQLLLMTAVESRLRQPVLTPGNSGGWTLTPPTGAVAAEFSLPRLDIGRIGFAGGGSALQPLLAWSMAAIPVNVGGAVSALNAWGSNMIMAHTIRPVPNTTPPSSNGSSSPFTQDQLSYQGDIPNRNGLSNAGRALQKHLSPSRGAKATLWQNFIQSLSGSKLPTTAKSFNETGAAIVDHIVMSPDTIWSGPMYIDGIGGLNVLRGMLPNGIGVQWNYLTGQFIGFVP